MDFIDFTIFDVFKKNNKVYLIISINNLPVKHNEIMVKLNKNKLTFNCKYEKNNYEPILIFVYNSNICKKNDTDPESNTDLSIEIQYKEITNKKLIEDVTNNNTNRKTLALTTLFKHDYKLFTGFYEYYKNQGVEHFYMYYNGVLNDEIRNIFNYQDVTLIEWNFRYWNLKKYKFKHHAQLGQMHHAIYKYGKNNYDYMIFNDLDEYLFIPNVKLVNYIKNNTNIDMFGFCNKWTRTIDDTNIIKEDLITSETICYGNRSKNIYKIDSIETIGIHKGYKYTIPKPIHLTNHIMYHFYNWTRKNRVEKTNIKTKIDLSFLYK